MQSSSIKYHLYPKSRDLSAKWFVEYSVNGGPRLKKYGKLNDLPTLEERLKEADRLFALIQQENQGSNIALVRADRNKLIKKMSSVVENRCVGKRKKTISGYWSKMAIFTKWYRVHAVQEEIEKEGIGTSFIIHLIKEINPKTGKITHPTTINHYKEFLTGIFEAIPELKGAKLFDGIVKTKKRYKSARYFQIHQQESLRKEIEPNLPQLWLLIQMQFFLLLRPNSEARFVKIEYFNFDEQSITIPWEISKNKKTQTIRVPDAFMPYLEFLKQYPPHFYVLGKEGQPSERHWGQNHFYEQHKIVLNKLHYTTRDYKLYSWKHTGAVMYYKATKDIKGLKEQGRWHSLDMVNEYLKNLGVLEMEEVKCNYPVIGGLQSPTALKVV